MKSIPKIAVIGGTGKSGTYLVNTLLDQGYAIKVLVRNPEKFQHQNPRAEVILGNVAEYEAVQRLIAGCDVVISALGSGIPPSKPTIFSQATEHIIRAMDEGEVRRYVLITGLNVDTPFDKKGPKTQAATEWMYANYPTSTEDRQREYRLLAESPGDWTLVRLPMIEQTNARGEVKSSLEDCPGDAISATDLAYFLIEQVTDHQYLRKSPFVATV